MPRTLVLSLILLSASTARCSTPQPRLTDIPQTAGCPKTVAAGSIFAPPAPYPPEAPGPSQFWFGSEKLWTALPTDGIWSELPRSGGGFAQKLFWWSESYVPSKEPRPELTVTGERLDSAAPPLTASRASNASARDIGAAMLVGLDFPAAGCWRITGEYRGEALSFVIQVTE